MSDSARPIEVLLIEDNSGDVLLVRRALASEPFPINVHVALDGDQALEILLTGAFKPNVVILDLNLPKLSGLELLEVFRPDAPVVVFTSSTRTQDRNRAFELGAKEFVHKPNDFDEYAHQLSQIVRNWAGSSEVVE